MGAFSSLRLALRLASLRSTIPQEELETSNIIFAESGDYPGGLEQIKSQIDPSVFDIKHTALEEVFIRIATPALDSHRWRSTSEDLKNNESEKVVRKSQKFYYRSRSRKRVGRHFRTWTRSKCSCAIPTNQSGNTFIQICAKDTSNGQEDPSTPSSSDDHGSQRDNQDGKMSQSHPQAEHQENQSRNIDALGPGAPGYKPPGTVGKKSNKPRIPAFDSVRFFLIAYIAVGHFISMATKRKIVLKILTQINVVVGAFFVLSGYVAAYTGTEVNSLESSPRLHPPHKYTISRIASYLPLHAFVQILFSPMFIFADQAYNGIAKTVWHGFISLFMCQAWFPGHAEVWNAPTWFLSALNLSQGVMPYALPVISRMRKRSLHQLLVSLVSISVLSKIAYSYDLNAWWLMEGIVSPRNHPNIEYWNVIRFHPFYALLEVLIGAAAARLVMIDGLEADRKEDDKRDQKSLQAAACWPLALMVATILARALGVLQLNDALTRGFIFIPLFTNFLMRLHRNTLQNTKKTTLLPPLSSLMASKPLTYLGGISFPLFIVHGPIGQLFYKKIIASKLFGQTMSKYGMKFFIAYMGICGVAAAALHHGFVMNKKVQAIVAKYVKIISSLI